VAEEDDVEGGVMDWIAYACFALVLGPPAVLAAVRPRTARWRVARRVFWAAVPLASADAAANVLWVDMAGPGWAVYSAWGVFLLLLAAVAWAAGTLRAEWTEWREGERLARTERRPWRRASPPPSAN
jgi:hypothetical protein